MIADAGLGWFGSAATSTDPCNEFAIYDARVDSDRAGSTSFWHSDVEPATPRPGLDGDRDVDVVIVGAGYTGLWTAHSLLVADPTLKVLILERAVVGSGASGRNGGWCVGELASGLGGALRLAERRGLPSDAGVRLTRAAMDSVDEVGRVVADEGIECGFVKGGSLRLARNGAQLIGQREEIDHLRHHGLDDAVHQLDADEARSMLAASDVLGGMLFKQCARVHPLQLVQGLAVAVERRGGTICEQTAVHEIVGGQPARVVTNRGIVRAGAVVRATEGHTRDLPGERRTLLPFFSLMVATEVLTDEQWDEIGLSEYQTFADDRRMVIYGQRTIDGRIAFGGRGAPYAMRSRIDPEHERGSDAHDRVVESLLELLPVLRTVAITHRWGGVLGIPRDWRPSVGFDRATGLAWGGGYVGEGVAAANLVGRTLADLMLRRDTDLVTLPWVDHRSRKWEPEPFRWIGVNGMLQLTDVSDRSETKTGRPSPLGALADRLRR
jgi:glycine/D-amino acid oxidase-like deaminating enzyme